MILYFGGCCCDQTPPRPKNEFQKPDVYYAPLQPKPQVPTTNKNPQNIPLLNNLYPNNRLFSEKYEN